MNKRKCLSWALWIGWLLLIFFFSSQTGEKSSNLSSGLLSVIGDIFFFPTTSEVLSFSIRKLAHFSEYMILALLSLNLILQYTKMNFKVFAFALFFCAFYAFSDEFHQLFIDGRSGQLIDVMIDTLGSLFGLVLYQLKMIWRGDS